MLPGSLRHRQPTGTETVRTPPSCGRQLSRPLAWVIPGFLLAGTYLWVNMAWIWRYVVSCESDFQRYILAARSLLRGQSPYTLFDFDYPPLVAFLFLPFAPLSDLAAHVLWFACNHALYLYAAWRLWRHLGGDRIAGLSVGIVWVLMGAAPQSFALGQVNALLLVLILLWIGSATGGWVRRELPIALGCAIKLWPGGLLLPLVFRRRWWRLWRGLSLITVAVVVPYVGLSLFFDGPSLPRSSAYWLGTPSIFNLSLPALFTRIMTAPPSGASLPETWIKGNLPSQVVISPFEKLVSLISAVTALALLLLILGRMRPRRQVDPTFAENLAVLAGLFLAMPIVWTHYYLVLSPVLAFLFCRYWRSRRFSLAAGTLLLELVMTWLPLIGLDWYLGRYGYTLQNPLAFWLITGLPLVGNSVVFAMLLQASTRRSADCFQPTVELAP